MSDDDIQVKFSADIQGLLEGLKSSQEHLETATEAMKGNLGSMIESFEKFGMAAVGIGAVGLAFEGLKECFEWVGEAIEKTTKLSRTFEALKFQTGESYEALNVLNAGMQLTGGTVDELQGWMKGATRAMNANSEMLVANGIAADKAALMAMPFQEYLKRVMEAADSIQEPFRRAQFLTESLGRAGMESAPQIRRLLETLGGGEAQTAFDAFGKGMDEHVKAKLEEIEKAEGAVKIATQALDAQMAVSAANWAKSLSEMKLGWKQFEDAIRGGQSKVSDALMNMFGDQAAWKNEKSVGGFWGALGVTETVAPPPKPQEKHEAAGASPSGEQNGSGKKIDLSAEVAAKEAAAKAKEEAAKKLAEELAKIDAADEAVYLANVKKTDEEEQKIHDAAFQKDVARKEMLHQLAVEAAKEQEAIAKRQAADQEAIAKLKAADQMNASKMAIETQKTRLDQEVAMGQMSAGEELTARGNLMNQEYALDLAAFQRERDLTKEGTKDREEAENKIAALKRKNALDNQKLEGQDLLAMKKGIDDVTADWNQGIQKMLAGTMSLHQGVIGALKGIGNFFETMVIQMGLDWAKGQALELAATFLTNEEYVQSAAAVAAGNAASAVAAIPIVGPALMPEAAAAAEAEVLAFVPQATSSGGWDYVTGNGPSIVHVGETVMSAPLAEGFRNLISIGGNTLAAAASGGSGTGGGGAATHLHFHTPDALGAARFFQKYQRGLLGSLGNAAKMGRIN